MQEKRIIKSSTIGVTKDTLEEIKVYCRKAGQPTGEFVDTVWDFIKRNDFDIYDKDSTPFLPVQEEPTKEANQVEALCKLMSEFIISQKQIQLPSPDTLLQAATDKAKAEIEIKHLSEQVQEYKEEAKQTTQKITELTEQGREQRAEIEKYKADIEDYKKYIEKQGRDLRTLEDYNRKAYSELCRVRDEQPTIGKIKVKTEF